MDAIYQKMTLIRCRLFLLGFFLWHTGLGRLLCGAYLPGCQSTKCLLWIDWLQLFSLSTKSHVSVKMNSFKCLGGIERMLATLKQFGIQGWSGLDVLTGWRWKKNDRAKYWINTDPVESKRVIWTGPGRIKPKFVLHSAAKAIWFGVLRIIIGDPRPPHWSSGSGRRMR